MYFSFSLLVLRDYSFPSLSHSFSLSLSLSRARARAPPPPPPPSPLTQHLSSLIIVIALILAIFQLVSYSFFWLALSGTTTAWIYLRFYQKRDQGLRGDMSEGFSFATFFPELLHPLLSTLGGFVYHLLVSVKVCPKTVRTYDVGAPSTIKLTLPGTDPADAQRRKYVSCLVAVNYLFPSHLVYTCTSTCISKALLQGGA